MRPEPPSDPQRMDQVYRDIHRVRTDYYSWFLPSHDRREGPFLVADRPWQDVPEPSKLIILQDTIDWSGISSKVQARILLAEIDPAKLADAQRHRLITMAGLKEPDSLIGQARAAAPAQPAPERGNGRPQGRGR